MTSENLPTIISILCTAIVALAPYVHAYLEHRRSEYEYHRNRKFEILEKFSEYMESYVSSDTTAHLPDAVNRMYLYCDNSCYPLLDEISACIDAGYREQAFQLSRELISSINLRKKGVLLTCSRKSRKQGK